MNRIKLGSILHMEKGRKPKHQQSEMTEGLLPYVDIKAFEEGIINSYAAPDKCLLCNDGDLLIVCDGSRSGLTGYAIKGVVGSTLSKISADGLTTKYLQYFIQSKYILLNTRKKGTGTPHLNTEILKRSELVIPTIPEQEHIVSKIEELFSRLDASVAELQTAKEKLKVYRQAVLKDAFAEFKIKKPIREVTSIVTSGSRGWAKYYSSYGAKFIRIGNLTSDSIKVDCAEVQYVTLPKNAEGIRTKLQTNDVLISITANLGSIGFVPDTIGDAYINQHIALVRFTNSNQSEFMAWYLRSDLGQKDLLKNKRGAGKLGLGLDDIRETKVPLVSDEQAISVVSSINSRLSVCDSIEQTIDTSLQQAEALRQSILKQAFEGRLIDAF